MSKKKKICTSIYMLIMTIVIGIIVILAINYHGMSQEEDAYNGTITLDHEWVDKNQQQVNITDLSLLTKNSPNHSASIYYTLPDTIDSGTSLSFRTTHIYYKVYIDGKIVCDPYIPESDLYTKSFGTRWNFINLEPEDAGKVVEIRFTTVYDNDKAKVDQSYLGSDRGIVLHLIVKRMPAFVTSIILLFIGFFLLALDVPFSRLSQKHHELMYLGLLAICVASWCLVDIQLIQFFLGNSRLLHVLACYDVMLIPVPAILYLDEAFPLKRRFLVYGLCGLSFLEFVVCTGLHIAGIADLQETLAVSYILIGCVVLIILYVMFKEVILKRDLHVSGICHVLHIVGLICFTLSGLVDGIRFFLGKNMDASLFIIIGLLIFIICYGCSSLSRMVKAVEMGAQAEFVSQLAYRDGLTGLGNRTAFQELLDELLRMEEQGKEQNIGIIMFDVNDLKAVNDYLSHSVGDKMLLEAANCMKDAFLPVQGQYFRIGGDEFVVILTGENVLSRCEKGLERFDELVNAFNLQLNREFHLSVAYGYSIYDSREKNLKIAEIYQEADRRMYENKKEMKKDRKRGELYNTGKLFHSGLV